MGAFTGALAKTGVGFMTELAPVLMSGDKFDLKKFFDNLAKYCKDLGHYAMVFFGVVMIIVAVYQIFKGLAGGGRGQVNWVMTIGCLLVGGMLVAGGWKLAAGVAAMGKDTMVELATGSYDSEIDASGGGGTGDSTGSIS